MKLTAKMIVSQNSSILQNLAEFREQFLSHRTLYFVNVKAHVDIQIALRVNSYHY